MLNTNEIRIETSTMCNLRCVFCPHSTHLKRYKEIMSFDFFKFLLDKVTKEESKFTDVTISGFGEAFLDDSIIQKIRYATEKGLNVHVLTNGTFLNKTIINQLLELNIYDIRISLHATDPMVWSKITGGSPFWYWPIRDSVDYIIANKKSTKLNITADIVDINREEVEPLIKTYSDVVDNLEIWKPHNWIDTFNYRNGLPVRSTCSRPVNSPLQIQVDGTVNMCCFDYNGQLTLGDLRVQTLEGIFSSRLYTDLYEAHTNGTLDNSNFVCKNCDQRKSQKGVVIFNNKFSEENRLGKTSTTYDVVYK